MTPLHTASGAVIVGDGVPLIVNGADAVVEIPHAVMVTVSVVWNLALAATGRRVTAADVRQVAIPGVFFGLNLAVFFAGATHNSVANAALIGSLAPFFIVPGGAWLFGERIVARALAFAVLAFGGTALVLLNAPPGGDASLGRQRLRADRDGADGRLGRLDAVLPPRHGRDDVHGDDLPDRRARGGADRARPRRRARHERDGLDVHADPDAPQRSRRPPAAGSRPR